MSDRTLDLVAILAALAALAGVFLALSPVPSEDACILFRYSRHLAEGQGIVWNIGEDPVEGATEFLWMIVMAGVHLSGLPPLPASQAIGLLLSAATCVLLYSGSRRILLASRAASLIAALAFAASTPALHAGTAFATPLFTLLTVAAVQRALRLLDDPLPSRAGEAALAGLLLLACLTRPEGVLLAGLIYLAVAAGRPRLLTVRFLATPLLLLALPGAIYFAWRWGYFGFPLPNTWYVKAGTGGLEPASVAKVSRFLIHFCGAPLAALLLSRARRETPRDRASLLLAAAAVGYMASYGFVAMIQDVGYRFLFPGYAMLLTLLPRPLDRLAGPGRGASWRRIAAAGIAAMTLVSGPRMVRASGYHAEYDDRFDVGSRLERFRDAGLTMVATEAGYLPYLSRWRAIDPFGLNDERIAHEGFSEADISRRGPELVMFHVDTPEYQARWTPPGADRWEAMTKGLYRFAEGAGYERVAVIRKGCDESDGYHWYYLKRGVPEGEAIAAEIREAGRSATGRCKDRAR